MSQSITISGVSLINLTGTVCILGGMAISIRNLLTDFIPGKFFRNDKDKKDTLSPLSLMMTGFIFLGISKLNKE